jgi:muramoyltetrapeptide carboxypeptidase LdcA involved in peptidoglycan recycling
MFGTKFDGTKEFIEKYKDKKIIWHFDIYAMSSVDVYLTLIQMKNLGYFKYSDTFIFGTVMYPKIDCELEYSEAYKKALGNKNIIVDANIGHLKPRFTILNGSLGKITFNKKELRIKQELMYEDNG